MKKIFVIALLLCVVFSGVVFAADWTVKNVTGKVEREVAPGQFEAVKTGDVLNDAARIKAGINSRLVLRNGSVEKTVTSAKTDTLEKLIAADNADKNINVGKGKVSGASGAIKARTTQSSSTASSRASEAVQDVEWVMEE